MPLAACKRHHDVDGVRAPKRRRRLPRLWCFYSYCPQSTRLFAVNAKEGWHFMAQPRHVGCSVCCLPGADCPRTASCVGSVSLSLWGRGDPPAGPFMASQTRWSRTVGGPLDSEAPWLALRLRREYSFDNRDLGLKVRMGPGRKLPVKRVWYFARF